MKYNWVFIIAVQFLCVVILSMCGIVAFSNSGMYAGFEETISKILPSAYLSLLVFLVLLVPGVFFIIVRNKGGGILTVVVMLLSLPSILAYDNIDLLKIFGGASHVTTRMTLFQMLSIGSLIITAYFLLDLINQLKLNYFRLKTQGAPPSDIKIVLQNQHLISIILAGAALLVSLVITAVARGFEYFISKQVFSLSWWIVPVALFFILILGIYLYWATTRKSV